MFTLPSATVCEGQYVRLTTERKNRYSVRENAKDTWIFFWWGGKIYVRQQQIVVCAKRAILGKRVDYLNIGVFKLARVGRFTVEIGQDFVWFSRKRVYQHTTQTTAKT